MSRRRVPGCPVSDGFPRVSGDEPPNAYGEDYVREFSPRERG